MGLTRRGPINAPLKTHFLDLIRLITGKGAPEWCGNRTKREIAGSGKFHRRNAVNSVAGQFMTLPVPAQQLVISAALPRKVAAFATWTNASRISCADVNADAFTHG